MRPIVSGAGRPPEVSDLLPFTLVNDGHVTAMQVRDRRTRGVALHLRRLVDAHHELAGIYDAVPQQAL